MKIRKNYTLYINRMLGTATFGNSKFSNRISSITAGEIFDCNFSELKHNIKILAKQGFDIIQRKW